MPFVMMCGLPSSGKSYLVAKLVEYLKNDHKKNVHVIDDAAYLSSSKNSIYQGLKSIVVSLSLDIYYI